jgi:hypothetical protein
MGVVEVPVGPALAIVGERVVVHTHADQRMVLELVDRHPPQVVALATGRSQAQAGGRTAFEVAEVVPLALCVRGGISDRCEAPDDRNDRYNGQAGSRDHAKDIHDGRPCAKASLEHGDGQPEGEGDAHQRQHAPCGDGHVVGGDDAMPAVVCVVGGQEGLRDRSEGSDDQQRQPRSPHAVGAGTESDHPPDAQTDHDAPRLRKEGQGEHERGKGQRQRPQHAAPVVRRSGRQQRPEREAEQARGGVAVIHRSVEASG